MFDYQCKIFLSAQLCLFSDGFGIWNGSTFRKI